MKFRMPNADDVSVLSDGFVRGYLENSKIEKLNYNTPIQVLIAYLDGLGKDRVRYAVEEGIPLSSVTGPIGSILAGNADPNDVKMKTAMAVPSGRAAKIVHESLSKYRPDWGRVVTVGWLMDSIERYRAEVKEAIRT